MLIAATAKGTASTHRPMERGLHSVLIAPGIVGDAGARFVFIVTTIKNCIVLTNDGSAAVFVVTTKRCLLNPMRKLIDAKDIVVAHLSALSAWSTASFAKPTSV